MMTIVTIQPALLPRTFKNLRVGVNPYVQFGYVPQTIYNHTWEQVSGSIDYELVNAIYTNQQSTINKNRIWWINLKILYIKPMHQLMSTSSYTQPAPFPRPSSSLRGSKSVFLVWIRPTGNFQSYLRNSFRINEHWSNKPEQTSQQSTMLRSKLKI